VLYEESLKIGRLIDYFVITSFETYIKGREEVILRQTDEMAEIYNCPMDGCFKHPESCIL
ncbi:MAG TPA: hypothetical protein VK518_16020, partial [Puia sp.]|nr:hypothetical protein [Puia sp.]